MSEEIRFIHASDFHLEQTPYGLSEVPEHLRDELIDAPLQAAARVFEAALLEDVDFVILSGDIINPRAAGPYAIALLLEQFELLREQRIRVYCAAGRGDALDEWPEEVQAAGQRAAVSQGAGQAGGAPGRRAAGGHAAGHQFHLRDRLGRRLPDRADEPPDDRRRPRSGRRRGAGGATSRSTTGRWAVRISPRRCSRLPQQAHYPGTPQGRCPAEEGAARLPAGHGRPAAAKSARSPSRPTSCGGGTKSLPLEENGQPQ